MQPEITSYRTNWVALAATGTRFLVVGGTSAALSYVLFRVMIYALGGRPSAAGIAQGGSYAGAMGLSYLMNHAWTFRTDRAHTHALPRFLASHLCSLLVSVGLVQAAVARGHSPTVSWVAAAAVTTVLNFVMQRYWVFATR